MTTLTIDQQNAIRDKIASIKHIPAGIGTADEACSIAAINLALSGELKDEIPKCMSPVIGRWIIRVQDAMPDKMRNSLEWRMLLPLAAGTGRDHDLEKRRKELIFDWMWAVVLPTIQPIADKRGFGEPWAEMLSKKDRASAQKARTAAAAAAAYAAAYAVAAAAAAYAADAAAAAAAAAAYAAAYAADAAYAAYAADAAADADAKEKVWQAFNPIRVLSDLVALI